jgi:hypothetical protein
MRHGAADWIGFVNSPERLTLRPSHPFEEKPASPAERLEANNVTASGEMSGRASSRGATSQTKSIAENGMTAEWLTAKKQELDAGLGNHMIAKRANPRTTTVTISKQVW